jgi:hypothetical protein
MEEATAQAEIDRAMSLVHISKLKGEAEVERMLANAQADTDQALSQTDAAMASADADASIVMAEVAAKRRAADALHGAVKARFHSRRVEVDCDRICQMVNEYHNDAIRRTDLEASLAQAKAAREESRDQLAVLKNRQRDLQRAAVDNWDARLANLKDRSVQFETGDQFKSSPTDVADDTQSDSDQAEVSATSL